MRLKLSQKILLIGLLIAPLTGMSENHPGQQVTTICNFGDSLSDPGNLVKLMDPLDDLPNPPFFNNHLSNGTNMPEILASSLGLPLKGFIVEQVKNYNLDGRNFAFAGARARNQGDLSDQISVPTQVKMFTDLVYKGVTLDCTRKEGLNIIMAGGNDIRDAITVIAEGGTLEDAEGIVDAAATSISVDVLTPLMRVGAQNFIVINAPDLSKTPETLSYDNDEITQAAQHLTQRFNKRLFAETRGLPNHFNFVNMTYFDLYKQFNELLLSAEFYEVEKEVGCIDWEMKRAPGFKVDYSYNEGCNSTNINSRVFFDEIHPTHMTNMLLAAKLREVYLTGNEILKTMKLRKADLVLP